MLKDICLTPQIFEESYLLEDTRWKEVKSLLNNIKISGYIVGLNNKEWIRSIREEISRIDNHKIKDLFISLIDNLKDRNRIAGHPKSDIVPSSEEDWVTISDMLHKIDTFYARFATQNYEKGLISIDDLAYEDIEEKYGNRGSAGKVKTEEELRDIFRPLLSYAKKLTIIDPYFNITEKRYENTLHLMLTHYRNKRGEKDNGSVVIHCSAKNEPNERWSKKIDELFKEYGHTIIIKCWDRKDLNSLKLHERYIVTDQAAIVSGAGLDKDEYQQSEWSIKSYEDRAVLLNQYNENYSDYTLVDEITASGIKHFI